MHNSNIHRRNRARARPLLLVALACACHATLPPFDYSREPDPRKQEFVIGVTDGLRVMVWKNPELSTDARVRPDGTITMPLVGDLRAAGRTPTQLKDEITRRLASFIKDESTTVSVAVTEVNSYRVTVSGNVERAGVFTPRYYVTLADAIALAGGPNRFASTDRVTILRQDGHGNVRKIPIDFDKVRSGDRPDQNLVLIAGDTVFVP